MFFIQFILTDKLTQLCILWFELKKQGISAVCNSLISCFCFILKVAQKLSFSLFRSFSFLKSILVLPFFRVQFKSQLLNRLIPLYYLLFKSANLTCRFNSSLLHLLFHTSQWFLLGINFKLQLFVCRLISLFLDRVAKLWEEFVFSVQLCLHCL